MLTCARMTSPPAIGLLAWTTLPGERSLPLAEVAARCETSEAGVLRSLGGQQVRVTDGTAYALAIDAARRCLASSETEAAALDAIVFCGEQEEGLRLQAELGATAAHGIAVGGRCDALVLAMWTAHRLVLGGGRRVLIVSGERHPTPNAGSPPTETNYRQIFSDGGAAALVGPSDRYQLLGFGFATDGRHWDYWAKDQAFRRGELPEEALPDDGQVHYDSLRTRAIALERCLADAGVSLDQIDHFSLPSRVRPLAASTARVQRIPFKRVITPTYSHLGRSDCLFDLGTLTAGDAEPLRGQLLLLMMTTIGVFRCAIVRL